MTTIARHTAFPESGTSRAIVHAVWRLLASLHLALFLIVALSVVVFAGTLIDQAPVAVASDPVAYAQWLDEAQSKYGAGTGTLDDLQLFNIFHSVSFRALLGALVVNIIVCTMSRWRGIWATTFHTRARATEAFITQAHHSARLQTAIPATEAAELLGRTLSKARYRVELDSKPGSVAVFGDKNRLFRFGTFFTHLGLVLILVGAIAGGIWGFDNPRFAVAEGSTRELGLGTSLSLQLNQFADDYNADGSPSDFRSEVTLLDAGVPVKTGVIRVNSPMRYAGVAFHQSFFGQAAVITVREQSGAVVFSDSVPLSGDSEGGRPAGSFTVPGRDIVVRVIGPSVTGDGRLVRPGEVRLDVYENNLRADTPRNLVQGEPAAMAGLNITFEREVRFAGLNVVKDPGMNIIWAACAFMVSGLVMVFYFPRRRVWALCIEHTDGPAEVIVGMPAQRDASLVHEFESLRGRLAHALEGTPVEPIPEGDHHG